MLFGLIVFFFTKIATKKNWIIIAILFLAVIVRQIIFVNMSDSIENFLLLIMFASVYVVIMFNLIAKFILDKKNRKSDIED